MSNGPSTEFKKRILEEVKKLSDKGERIEAYELFKVYFPDKEMNDKLLEYMF